MNFGEIVVHTCVHAQSAEAKRDSSEETEEKNWKHVPLALAGEECEDNGGIFGLEGGREGEKKFQ